MNLNEEKYAAFYNKGALLVKDMKDNEIRAWQDEMAGIALEARAMILAGDAELRKRGADKKEWLVQNNQPDPNVTNAINVIKKKPLNKADKLAADMLKLGLDDAFIANAMKDVVVEGKAYRKPAAIATFVKQDSIPVPVIDKETLLSQATNSLIDALTNNGRPVEDIVSIAVTAAHLANKQLNATNSTTNSEKVEQVEPEKQEKPSFLKGLKFGN